MTPPPVVSVRPESFKASSKAFSEINKAIGKAAFVLGQELATMNGMAGSDSKAKAFSDQYDELTNGKSGLGAGIKLMADATDKMAELLDASAVNHTNADTAIAPCAPGIPSGLSYVNGQTDKPTIASAFGGPGEPSNWEMIKSYVEGEIFPDGDPEKLDKAAEAWRKMGTALREQSQRVDAAIAHIANEKSAEVEPAQTQAGLIKQHLADIANAHDKTAKLLTDFATHVRDVRDETKDALTELAWELVGGLVLGAALSLVTAGASALASTAVGVVRLTQTGAKIAGFIRRFGAAIDRVMQTVDYMTNPVAAATGDLGALMGTRATTFGSSLARKIDPPGTTKPGSGTQQERTPDGKFTGNGRPGFNAEEAGLRQYREDFPNREVITKQQEVEARTASGEILRTRPDGYAQRPDGTWEILEIKSGSGTLSPGQRVLQEQIAREGSVMLTITDETGATRTIEVVDYVVRKVPSEGPAK
ncbi:hypothetical protein [Tsukamurella strandjordii]|uniref:Outer membrane channel protein CpnT-like N-terminal domain-containing protein n=1 Tax=Tsukamurella strandjordii TaxID=147577 RepID=A0AA90NDN5_9ACTN|nr:hypothetical protein [Tsukamurella strandjordii]MDP0400008.1 hypothetical protein [Tsukamurella strandjordii]